MATKLSAVKPIRIPSYEMFPRLKTIDHVPVVVLTVALYRAKERLIKAAIEWEKNTNGCTSHPKLTPAVLAYIRATRRKA